MPNAGMWTSCSTKHSIDPCTVGAACVTEIFLKKHIDSLRRDVPIDAMRRSTPYLLVLAIAALVISLFVSRLPKQTSTSANTAPPRPWPHQKSDISPDPLTRYGQLPNGFRYMIHPNASPPKRLSLRLHIAAGSLMEAEDQRGLAHFLEHMVFNGSKNFTPDELVPRMQRLGIGFGAHVNAYTSFDETVYMLDLPDENPDTLNLAMTVMRDFGDGALLKEEEIEKERGVILSEKNSRDSVQYRLMQMQFQQLLPESLIPRRFPIGEESVIRSAQRERFVDFYQRYYTPSRMTMVIIGDCDPVAMEQRVNASFASMSQPLAAGANPNMGVVQPLKEIQAAVFADAEVTSTELSMIALRPYQLKPDTRSERIALLPLSLANSILSRRFDRLAKLENAKILSGSASRDVIFNHIEMAHVEVTVKDTDWQNALPVLEQEQRRVRLHGFTNAELEEAKALMINQYEQAVHSAATRKSDELATAVARSISDESVFSTPQTDLEIVRSALAEITPATCHQAFNAFWKDDVFHLVLTTQKSTESDRDALLQLLNQSRQTTVAAPVNQAQQAFAYEQFGQKGEVIARKSIDDLGITQLSFANGVRVNWKKTDFDQHSISIVARMPGGLLSQPLDKPGLTQVASALINRGGLGKHSEEDLQQMFAGKNVGYQLQINEDAFLLQGETTPDDLLLQCQLMCAAVTDPGYRDEALREFRAELPMLEQKLKHTAAGSQAQMNQWLHQNDPRYAAPDVNLLAKWDAHDVKSWLQPVLQNAPLEVSIVGDFVEEPLLKALSVTFGALPQRAQSDTFEPQRQGIQSPAAPEVKEYTYSSKVPQAMCMVHWKTDGLRQRQLEKRRMNLVAEILTDRLRAELREKLGASYSPDAGIYPSDAIDGFGFIIGMSAGKPEDATRLTDIIARIGEQLGAEGATADELQRARNPLLASIEKTLRDNSYWLLTVLHSSQSDPQLLELARTRSQDYKSISLEEVNAIAKKYLVPERRLTTRMISAVDHAEQ